MTRKIFVDYSGVIRSHSGQKQEWVEIKEDMTVQDLLTKLGYRKDHHKFIIITIDGNKADLETKLEDNVSVTLFLPAGGG